MKLLFLWMASTALADVAPNPGCRCDGTSVAPLMGSTVLAVALLLVGRRR